MVNLSTLPPEIFLTICCFLDPASLDAVALTAKYYRQLINDEVAWRSAFEENFKHFSSFSGLASSWRAEYTLRAALLRRYIRGRGTSISFDAKIGNISHISFEYQSSRILCGNISNGLGSIADSTTGRVGKDLLFPAATRLISRDVSAICVFKQGIAYGFQNGLVAMNLMAKNALSSSFRTFTGWHTGPVSAICVADHISVGQNVTLISGGMEGKLNFWDHGSPTGIRLAEISISEAPIVSISWDQSRFKVVVLTSQGLHLLNIESLSDIRAVQLARWSSDTAVPYLNMICDHRASIVIVARESHLYKYSLGADLQEIEIQHGLPGQILKLTLDCTEQDPDKERPGSGGRLFCVADDCAQGTIVVFDMRADVPTAICRIQRDNGPITALAQNSVVVASGAADGSVVLNEALSGRPLRSVSSRIAKFERIAEEDPARTTVGCISLHERHSSGVVAIGGQLKVFDYDPRGDRTNGKRRGLGRKRLNNSSEMQASQQGKILVQNHIRDEMMEMSEKRRSDQKQQARLRQLGGDLDLDDTEMLAYATLLSQEESKKAENRADALIVDDDLSEAIRRSLGEAAFDSHSDYQPATTHGEEDYELGIALSRSLAENRRSDRG